MAIKAFIYILKKKSLHIKAQTKSLLEELKEENMSENITWIQNTKLKILIGHTKKLYQE